jgi:putative membrane protein
MTAWDAVMDPGKAKSGAWIWEKGGPYFGVPFQNFVGWIATTLAIYLIVAGVFRLVPRRRLYRNTRFYTGLPVFAYALVAFDHLLIETIPELHVVAAFGICLVALLAILRLILVRNAIALPD